MTAIVASNTPMNMTVPAPPFSTFGDLRGIRPSPPRVRKPNTNRPEMTQPATPPTQSPQTQQPQQPRLMGRIASLEKTIEWMQGEHAGMVAGLHAEIGRLQGVCADLSVKLAIQCDEEGRPWRDMASESDKASKSKPTTKPPVPVPCHPPNPLQHASPNDPSPLPIPENPISTSDSTPNPSSDPSDTPPLTPPLSLLLSNQKRKYTQLLDRLNDDNKRKSTEIDLLRREIELIRQVLAVGGVEVDMKGLRDAVLSTGVSAEGVPGGGEGLTLKGVQKIVNMEALGKVRGSLGKGGNAVGGAVGGVLPPIGVAEGKGVGAVGVGRGRGVPVHLPQHHAQSSHIRTHPQPPLEDYKRVPMRSKVRGQKPTNGSQSAQVLPAQHQHIRYPPSDDVSEQAERYNDAPAAAEPITSFSTYTVPSIDDDHDSTTVRPPSRTRILSWGNQTTTSSAAETLTNYSSLLSPAVDTTLPHLHSLSTAPVLPPIESKDSFSMNLEGHAYGPSSSCPSYASSEVEVGSEAGYKGVSPVPPVTAGKGIAAVATSWTKRVRGVKAVREKQWREMKRAR
ncbi:hypothetical protein HDV00_006993 [Rhizophlyctis rosea]|nr:hypothetical protein HDV00_006993 [Rhizophlyctis rosea]